MLKKWMNESKKNQKGLTLVELLAVVVILAIVAAIAFVLIGNVIENSKKDAHVANAQQVISAVKLAEASGDIKWETNKADVTKLETIGSLVDPWDKKKYTTAEVIKEKEIYKVTLSNATADAKCEISVTPEEELQQGRKEVCDQSSGN